MIVVAEGQTRATWPIRSESGANILPESIDQCKGYSAFAVLLDSLNVDQPDGGDGSDLGSGVSTRDKMSRSLAVSKVVVNAKEIELDGLAKDGAISIYAKHARVHSGDATLVQPVQQLGIMCACIDYVDVKAPLFSFTRLHGAGPSMGVELGSTGEMARFGTGMHEAHLTRCRVPASGYQGYGADLDRQSGHQARVCGGGSDPAGAGFDVKLRR
ncbi:uncharacterized protein PITG_09729 [Phytophthora infestans T30-4]|uniref:Uncharacterized protein n=1 Tax=Phytophthora infestans (strain T30-4) TaxID=403677 RepID=D0NCP0_PHYIT|nr:uncharacterized protein PITG_09729 [Phytophthora infestans T30-4]EEY55754.1 conserved hypothetical protein [Phytophthora infestans T30-4]|eukprot:XP_002903330.1 conserved hypothetical protein [Phytophthora infestans T30-4]